MPIITIKYDTTKGKMLAYGDDGQHGELPCQFPHQLRVAGARYYAERLDFVDDGNRKPFYRPIGLIPYPLKNEDTLKKYLDLLADNPDFEVSYRDGDVNDFFGDDYCACSVIVIYKANQQHLFRMGRIVGEAIRTYKFSVDISVSNGDEYFRSAIVTSIEQFEQLLMSTIEVLRGFKSEEIREAVKKLEQIWNSLG